jgi:succinate dehydrogenase / fumarate reductase iron-sulfur subunit
MNLKLIVWRQAGPDQPGRFETYEAKNITPHHSFLEMLDVVNEDLIKQGKDPIVFDHDCREGICGACSAVVNGVPHGGQSRTTLCQLHMRKFKDGDVIYLEPWRARAFPLLRDPHGGPRRARPADPGGPAGSPATPAACPTPTPSPSPGARPSTPLDAAECIGCGACVAACPNGAARSSPAPRSRSSRRCRRARSRPPSASRRMVKAMAGERVRELLEPLRVPGRLPQGHRREVRARLNREFQKALVLEKVGALSTAK